MHVRCVIVDDNDYFLEVAREALEREGIAVVGVATNTADALAQVGRLQPDVTLVDICLGDECGIELVDQLTGADSPHRSTVILISTYAERDFAEIIEASSAQAFLPKPDLSGSAIREILRTGGNRSPALRS
jgi:CheY-like chemotaxis protein